VGEEYARGTFDAMLAAAKRLWEEEESLGSPIKTCPTERDGPVTTYKKKLRALLQKRVAANSGAAGVDYRGAATSTLILATVAHCSLGHTPAQRSGWMQNRKVLNGACNPFLHLIRAS